MVESEDLIKVYLFGKEKALPEKVEAASKRLIMPTFKDVQGKIIKPPYDPTLWAELIERNTRLYSLIQVFARNTVGLGFRVVSAIELTEKIPEAVKIQVRKQREKVQRLFDRPNREMPFPKLMELTKVDEEATGNGYIEVVRDLEGAPAGLFHVPSHTVRILKDGSGFVQQRGQQYVYFKNYGDGRVMEAKTGEFKDEGKVPFEERASELLHFRIYSPRSSWYGIPRYVGSSAAITGNSLAAVRNVAFFENDAVPRLAILVTGGELSEKSYQSIEDFLRAEGKGPEKAHRVMLIEATSKGSAGLGKEQKVNVSVQPLTVGTSDDASFQNYRKLNDEEVREAFGIAKIFLGSTEDVNRSSAIISRQVTNEQVFLPDQRAKEFVLNQTIVRDLIVEKKVVGKQQFGEFLKSKRYGKKEISKLTGIKRRDEIMKVMDKKGFELVGENGGEELEFATKQLVKLEFVSPRAIDPVETARADDVYAKHGALTPNEMRSRLGLAPHPEEYQWAKKPFEMAMLELRMELAKMEEPGEKVESLLGGLIELRKKLSEVKQEEIDENER